MIDLETAKRLVLDRLSDRTEYLCTPPVLIEDKTEEYDWGWKFYWAPMDLSLVPMEEAKWGYLPMLVDRVTGNVAAVGTAGTKIALAHLLSDRLDDQQRKNGS